mgnify:CR=1 FL=1
MRRCFKTLSLILALLMLAGAFAGCGDQPGTAGESTKDSLVFSINADIVTTDCHMARDTVTGIVHYQIYETRPTRGRSCSGTCGKLGVFS